MGWEEPGWEGGRSQGMGRGQSPRLLFPCGWSACRACAAWAVRGPGEEPAGTGAFGVAGRRNAGESGACQASASRPVRWGGNGPAWKASGRARRRQAPRPLLPGLHSPSHILARLEPSPPASPPLQLAPHSSGTCTCPANTGSNGGWERRCGVPLVSDEDGSHRDLHPIFSCSPFCPSRPFWGALGSPSMCPSPYPTPMVAAALGPPRCPLTLGILSEGKSGLTPL